MYESLLDWCKFPVTIHRKEGFTAGGDPRFADPIRAFCYRVSKVKVITDKTGSEYASMSHFYLPPETNITVDDMVSFGDDQKVEVRGLNCFFDGTTGEASIWVVYL